MAYRDLAIVDRFFPRAKQLRREFDTRFADPRQAPAGRFVWDYWHVPGQYTALRTPAFQYFTAKLYREFHERLVWWGRRTLGCHDVSPPWLSCYVEGCVQHLHGDLPHGPFAFVYSLTPWEQRVFTGGETTMLSSDVLDYWHDFSSIRSLERPHLEREIAPEFNRLVVFDPRIPHGVRRVAGTHDPREGRLVIHGWFVSPRPFIEGPLPTKELEQRIADTLLPAIDVALQRTELQPAGALSVALQVSAAGAVTQAKWLCDTLRVPAAAEPQRQQFLRVVLATLRALKFSKRAKPSRITLPLVFER